ncbi:uncharacterized protein LOC113555272 [Rhopalosiphum maidis]|uniref:uncharacterized protein LOC113555272 n=1 Tax=Rhopalosiphum maidis TaxID=43146 RepID=UPI000F004582|nr:uncharacterized protein LOC113555272 [Rhopalosiphum maidis]
MMAICLKMALYFILIGELFINTMSYNPMLTYVIRFKKFYVTPNFTMDYYSFDQYKDTQYINGQFTINTKELINKVVAVFERCDPDGINCEYFQSWTVTGLCNKLKEKNQIWTRWYDSFDPPMRCPLNKGKYTMKNGTGDIGPILLLYPQATDYQWRVVQNMYANDIFVGSVSVEIVFFGYRKKIKSILNP